MNDSLFIQYLNQAEMKKLFFILLFALVAQSTYAQLVLRPQVGINTSSLSNVEDFDFDGEVGYQFGADLQIGNRFYVQPGILFEFLNNEATSNTGNNDGVSLQQNRFRIPLLVGFRAFDIDTDRWFNIRLFTGPNASFLTNSDVDENSVNIDKDDFKNLVWGWNAGLGYDLSILFVDLGYQFGLSDVIDNLDDAPRNNLFYANAGVRIRF